MTRDGAVPASRTGRAFRIAGRGLAYWLPWVATVLVWCYAGAMAAALLLLYAIGDRWWPSAFLLFGPRWLLALPLLALVPLALATRRRLLWPLLLSAVLLIGPVLGFCVPWGRASTPGGHPLRVLTCNVGGSRMAIMSIGPLVKQARPDVVALQEIRGDARFDWPDGWDAVRDGQLLIASRFPLRISHREVGLHPPHKWPRVNLLHCVVETPDGEVNVCNVHLPSPRYGIMEVLDRSTVIDPSRSGTLSAETQNRREMSGRAARWVDQIEGPVLVAGDFNMPRESAIYRHDWSRFANVFSRAGIGLGWTEWQTTLGMRYGVRIDHILMGRGWRSSRAWVGPDVGSDHLPLVADVVRIE